MSRSVSRSPLRAAASIWWRSEMKVYTYTEARQKLASLLDLAASEGVRIRA